MEAKRSKLVLWATLAALLWQNLVITAMAAAASFEDQKNYYIPDPYVPIPRPPTVPRSPPTPHHGYPPTPRRGYPPTPRRGYPPTPRRGYPPTPHHGGVGTPPAHCGYPPSGGHHPRVPIPPTGGGGGYYHSPPPSIPSRPPTVVTPPVYVAPPTTPIIIPGTPSTPGTTNPPPLFPFDPNSPPFPCNFWRNHPTLVWGLVGWWGTVGNAFGIPSLPSLPGFGAHTNVMQALSNTRTDGIGELFREGTAALLNSMAHTRFPYTTSQVRDSFAAALGSNQAAAAQARLFKMANEGQTKA